MEDMLWIEDIVEHTPTPPFLTNSRVGMANIVNLHKVVAKSAFSTFPSAWNGGENKKFKNIKVKKKNQRLT